MIADAPQLRAARLMSLLEGELRQARNYDGGHRLHGCYYPNAGHFVCTLSVGDDAAHASVAVTTELLLHEFCKMELLAQEMARRLVAALPDSVDIVPYLF